MVRAPHYQRNRLIMQVQPRRWFGFGADHRTDTGRVTGIDFVFVNKRECGCRVHAARTEAKVPSGSPRFHFTLSSPRAPSPGPTPFIKQSTASHSRPRAVQYLRCIDSCSGLLSSSCHGAVDHYRCSIDHAWPRRGPDLAPFPIKEWLHRVQVSSSTTQDTSDVLPTTEQTQESPLQRETATMRTL